MVRNVVLFSVLVYELVAPTLTKNALLAAGELHSEELLAQVQARKERKGRA